MTHVLGTPETTQAALGGFSLHPEVVGAVPTSEQVVVPPRYSPEEIATARAELHEMMEPDGAERMRIEGLNDVLAPKEDPRRGSAAARFYIRYEHLLGIVNSAYDRPSSSQVVRSVIAHGGGGE